MGLVEGGWWLRRPKMRHPMDELWLTQRQVDYYTYSNEPDVPVRWASPPGATRGAAAPERLAAALSTT